MSFGNPMGNPMGNPLRVPGSLPGKQRGEKSWTVPGTYQFVVPAGVRSICSVAIGAGSPGGNGTYGGGSGGSLGWANNILVTPGQTITVVVGSAAQNTPPVAGGESYISLDSGVTKVVRAPGGKADGSGSDNPTPNGFRGGAGGGVGFAWTGGGGAGGYTDVGGTGGTTSTLSGQPSASGGGGGGYSSTYGGGVGGGSWLYGTLSSGIGTPGPGATSSGGGQGRCDGYPPSAPPSNFGLFFGGGGGYGGTGGGAVRILWGDGRAFPGTDVGLPT